MVIIVTAVNETPSAILIVNENKKGIARANTNNGNRPGGFLGNCVI